MKIRTKVRLKEGTYKFIWNFPNKRFPCLPERLELTQEQKVKGLSEQPSFSYLRLKNNVNMSNKT